MSATAASLRDPRFLRGVSAFTWGRIFLIVWLVGMIVLIPIFLVQALNGFNRSSSWVVALVIPLIVINGGFAVIGRVRQYSEKTAGYATILTAGEHLDLLDAHSGAVIWRVGDPPVRAVGLLGTLRGEQASPPRDSTSAEPAFPTKRAASWALQFLPFLGALVAMFVFFSTTHSAMRAWGLVVIYLALAAFGGLVLLVVYLQTRLSIGRRTLAVSALRPEAMIFTSRATRELSTTLTSLGVVRGQMGRFLVVVTDSGMEFWGTSDAPWLSIPWAEVMRADPDSASFGNNTFRAVTVAFERADRSLSVTVPIYGRQGIFTASPSWANQVFDEIQFHVAKRPPAN